MDPPSNLTFLHQAKVPSMEQDLSQGGERDFLDVSMGFLLANKG